MLVKASRFVRGSGLSGVLILAAVACAPGLLGCQSPAAQRRMALREASLKWSTETLVQRERNAPARLGRTLARIEHDMQQRPERLERDLRWLDDSLEHEFQRWQTRQKLYVEKLEQIFGGKPENYELFFLLLL
jgi:hypothetical protein